MLPTDRLHPNKPQWRKVNGGVANFGIRFYEADMANEQDHVSILFPAPSVIHHAINVFVHGFCFIRSATHPYLAEQVDPLWVMRDAPRRHGSYRNEEWVAYGLMAEEIDRIVRKHAQNRYTISAICSLDDPQETLRAGFKALGYRLGPPNRS